YVERKLAENRYFLEFINIGISNFSNEEEKKIYRARIAEHYGAYQFFLRGQYSQSFEAIRDSQILTRELYHKITTEYYLPDVEKLLNINASRIVQSRDNRAIHLL